MDAVDISIIIVSWNAKQALLNCLESIRSTAASLDCEVLVVDNASSDGSPKAVREQYPWVRLIETGANLGFAKGNNVGIREGRGRYFTLINSDVVLKPDCLQKLIGFMDSHPEVGLAGPRLYNGDGTFQASCRFEPRLANHFARAVFLNTSLANPAYQGSVTVEIEILAGAFWIARPEAVKQVGLLDETFFFYGEDVDWCRRFRTAGWKVCFYPEAEAIHYGGGSSTADPSRFNAELQRAMLRVWEKYHNWTSTLIYLLVGMLYHFLRIPVSGLRCLRRSGRAANVAKWKQHWNSLWWLVGVFAARATGRRKIDPESAMRAVRV